MRWAWLVSGMFLWAEAARATGTVGMGFQAAWARPQDADRSLAYVGGHLRWRPWAWLGLEGALDYRKESYAGGSVAVRDTPATVSALFFVIPQGPVHLYWVGGTGLHFTRTEAGTVSDSRTFMGYHVGAGLQVVFGSVTLFGEYRYTGVKIHADVGPSASRLSLDAGGSNLRAGLTLWW